MMPEEWPIAVPAADGNVSARLARRGRLSTVRRDFFLDPAKRLTEQERALMTAMIHCLVGDVADATRAALSNGRVAGNDEGNEAVLQAMPLPPGCGVSWLPPGVLRPRTSNSPRLPTGSSTATMGSGESTL